MVTMSSGLRKVGVQMGDGMNLRELQAWTGAPRWCMENGRRGQKQACGAGREKRNERSVYALGAPRRYLRKGQDSVLDKVLGSGYFVITRRDGH